MCIVKQRQLYPADEKSKSHHINASLDEGILKLSWPRVILPGPDSKSQGPRVFSDTIQAASSVPS